MDAPRPLPPRDERLERLASTELDVLVVGGGITGAGIAHDLALRGRRVGIVERGDWASATSSASSRLIHGGLRYLEQFELGLVRESCLERALLLQNAAGLVWPERFTFPIHRGDRVGRARLGAGLALYTLVSMPRALGWPGIVSAREVARRVPAVQQTGLRGGGSYLDGATDDARLTVAVVTSAMDAGALALSRFEVDAIENGAGGVRARGRDVLGGESFELSARACVLAGGPFTDELRGRAALDGRWVQPTRGTHVLVPRERLPTDGAVIFTTRVDGRVLFLIPWPRYTVIGTTDLDADATSGVAATRDEVRYLLESANGLAPGAALVEDDVVASWAGLRPLLAAQGADPSARSREERVVREGSLYTIAGGKLTAYRSMAEGLCARLTDDLGWGPSGRRSATRSQPLRGALAHPVTRPAWSTWPSPQASPIEPVLARRYAALEPAVRAACTAIDDGRTPLGPETWLGEVDWAARHEDCLTAEDFLVRRTDLAYEPEGRAREVADRVLERLGAILSWSPQRRSQEAARAADALDRIHGWRRRDASPA